MIQFKSVEKFYPPHQQALKNIDLSVKEGDFIFLAGASGAGKSTLLRLIYGAETATSGQIVVAGRNLGVATRDAIAALRRDIGIVFQDYKLLTRKTVLENVAFGLEVRGVRASDRNEVALKLLETLGLADRANDFPQTLSGGEQQRVAVARALIHKPKLILADEPTGNLDHEMSRVIFELLLEANAAGVTVFVASHNLAVIEELNLRTVVLEKGKILGDFDRPGGLH